MKQRIALGVGLLTLVTLAGIVTFSFTSGQPPRAEATPEATKPAGGSPAKTASIAPDPASMPESTRRIFLSGRSAAEWLVRVDNPVNGRFHPGWLAALNAPLDRDNYLHQAGAASALAKAARYYGDERYLMKARQATLSLLAETQTDPADPSCRVTTLPTIVVDRLAGAGLLLMTIHELHEPAEELLKQGEELCNHIRKQQQADGSLRSGENSDAETARTASGWALHGLMLSQRHRPAAWKQELVARALPYHRGQWKSSPGLELAAALTPAFAEAYVRTREQAYADFVFEMSDWVCGLQYGPDASHAKWVGGFKACEQGKPVLRPPTISAAQNIEALAAACLLTRHVQDGARYATYREAVELGVQFLLGLQYTDSSTMHFAPAYRPVLIGGFHASLQDGNLRLDYQQHALTAMIGRLSSVGDR